MDKSVFSVVDYESIDIVNKGIAQLAALGATVVEPAEEDGGLFTPYLKKILPAADERHIHRQLEGRRRKRR